MGEGGKKKVCLALDTLLDRKVDFALIKTEGLDDSSRTRIQRGAQTMGRLGSHPHIVTVFDLGQEQDQPYIVTELMGGGDVEKLIDEAPDHRIALDQAINIAVETSRGLELCFKRSSNLVRLPVQFFGRLPQRFFVAILKLRTFHIPSPTQPFGKPRTPAGCFCELDGKVDGIRD